jgi:FixJ family two-component response regulator
MTFESAEDFLLSDSLPAKGCIVLDIRLPGMSGLDLCEKLAASGATHPVIFMTAHDAPQWQERAATMNAVAYLRKPFDQQSLFDAIHLIECHGPEDFPRYGDGMDQQQGHGECLLCHPDHTK